MMLIDTFVGPSKIEGVGIFATQAVRAGTAIWHLDERFDQRIRRSDVASFPAAVQAFIERYAYADMRDGNFLVLESDNGRFMNHAAAPNTDFRDTTIGYAIADIAAGTEITCDYGEFDPGYQMQQSRLFVGS